MTDLDLQVRRDQAHASVKPRLPQGVHSATISRIGPSNEVFATIPTQDARVEWGPLIAQDIVPEVGLECLIAITPEPGGHWLVIPSAAAGGGEVGPPGPTGPAGPTGPTGPAGPQGPTGATGTTGPQGPAGSTGATGATGPTGSTGAAGTPGEKWFSGSGAPAGATGIVGDWYLDTANGDIYEKTGTSTWTSRGNLRGPTGATGSTGSTGAPGSTGATGAPGAPGSVWRSGTGSPAGSLGIIGDWYENDANGDIYEKTGASTYTLRDNLTGPQGPTGATGSTGPTGATGAAGTVSPGSWTNIAGRANWVADTTGSSPRWRKDSSGTVFLEGKFRNTAAFAFGGANAIMGDVPTGARPIMNQLITVIDNDVSNGPRPIALQIGTDGTMTILGAGVAGVGGGIASVISIDNIHYLAA